MKSKSQIGKSNRRKGKQFENLVKEDLIKKGWIVLRNSNNVINNKFKQARPKFNPFTKQLMMNSSGFPDFLIYRLLKLLNSSDKSFKIKKGTEINKITFISTAYVITGVECKTNGYLTKEEKEKLDFLLDRDILSKVFIASKSKEGIKYIEYETQMFKV